MSIGNTTNFLLCRKIPQFYQGGPRAGQQPAQHHTYDEQAGGSAALCAVYPLQPGCDADAGGEMLYTRISSAAVQIQDAEEELSASATFEHGAISISATETALNIYLSERLRDFHAQYPGIRLRISNHSTPQAIQAVKTARSISLL